MTYLEKTRIRKSNLVILSLMMIFISGCFLQPVTRTVREFNFIDMDAPAVRLAEPVKAHILIWDEEQKKWVPAGVGEIPAGAYIKGRKPQENINEGND